MIRARSFSRAIPLVLAAMLLPLAGRPVPTRAQTDEDPAPPRPFAVTVTGSGRPMILIPGLTCGGNVWDGTVARFRDRFECHVLTLAGFAGEPAIEPPVLETVRDAVIAYIADREIDPPVVVGHSLGGFLALWIAATAPEAVGPIVSVDGLPFAAAVMMPGGAASPARVRAQAEAMRRLSSAQTPEQFRAQSQMYLSMMITDPKEVERILPTVARTDPKASGQAMYEMLTTDLREKVGAIRTPVLLVGSTAMAGTPEMRAGVETAYRDQVAAIPYHQVVFTSEARHFIQLDRPDFLHDEIEKFLAVKGASSE
jgi:pimeloyl-ACP methyl ester carboxylesterase